MKLTVHCYMVPGHIRVKCQYMEKLPKNCIGTKLRTVHFGIGITVFGIGITVATELFICCPFSSHGLMPSSMSPST